MVLAGVEGGPPNTAGWSSWELPLTNSQNISWYHHALSTTRHMHALIILAPHHPAAASPILKAVLHKATYKWLISLVAAQLSRLQSGERQPPALIREDEQPATVMMC